MLRIYQRVKARAALLRERYAAMLSSNRSQLRPMSAGRRTRRCHPLRNIAARHGSVYLSQISTTDGASRSRIDAMRAPGSGA